MRTVIVALVVSWVLASQVSHALVLPPDGMIFSQLHLQFEWDEVNAASSYDLEVYTDDGSGNPFASGTLVVDRSVPATAPR